MGRTSRQPVDARYRHAPRGPDDRVQAPRTDAGRAIQLFAGLILLLAAPALWAGDDLRVAVYHSDLSRKGPGLLLADLRAGKDPQVTASVAVIARAQPDVILLLGIDWDHGGRAVSALQTLLQDAGWPLPHGFATRPNTGRPTGIDIDRDGRLHQPEDAHGYGWFTGEGGMAILSRHPILQDRVMDFSATTWGAENDPDLPDPALAALRLDPVARWAVPIAIAPDRQITLLTLHAQTPVFDGPEDRNGLRNAAQLRVWPRLLDAPPTGFPDGPYVILGTFNQDPERGEGRRPALAALLSDPRFQDPVPRAPDGRTATAFWPDLPPLRVDYLLPDRRLSVQGSGIDTAPPAATAGSHRLAWLDLALP